MKKSVDRRAFIGHTILKFNQIDQNPLINFHVVAVHRVTGEAQFATIPAPSQKDAEDFVADMQTDWIVVQGDSLIGKEIAKRKGE